MPSNNMLYASNSVSRFDEHDTTTEYSSTPVQQFNDYEKEHYQGPPLQQRSNIHQRRPSIGLQLKNLANKTVANIRESKSNKIMVVILIIVLIGSMIGFILYFHFSADSFAIGNNETVQYDINGNVITNKTTSDALNGFYYWTTMTSTVGFGDICPKTPAAKILTSIYQIILFVISMGAIWVFTDGKLKKIYENMKKYAPSIPKY